MTCKVCGDVVLKLRPDEPDNPCWFCLREIPLPLAHFHADSTNVVHDELGVHDVLEDE